MKIGILAVQGAFAEHKSKLEKLGADCVELRKKRRSGQRHLRPGFAWRGKYGSGKTPSGA